MIWEAGGEEGREGRKQKGGRKEEGEKREGGMEVGREGGNERKYRMVRALQRVNIE